MATIVSLAQRRNLREGVEVRDALVAIVAAYNQSSTDDSCAGSIADYLLASLWASGFKVVPLEPNTDFDGNDLN